MNQQDIGLFIAKCRKEKGLTQAQLAERLGVSDKSISRWENGRTMPDLALYEPLCKVLDVQIAELLYAKKMTIDEKVLQAEVATLSLFKTKGRLETFAIWVEILIFVGVVITMTLSKLLAVTTVQMILTVLCGSFVWGFGLFLRMKIKKAVIELENY